MRIRRNEQFLFHLFFGADEIHSMKLHLTTFYFISSVPLEIIALGKEIPETQWLW